MDTIRTFDSKQEFVNTICREYADFLGFNLNRIECNERYFDTVYRYAGKVDTLIDWINGCKKRGKYYVICDNQSTYIMPVNVKKRNELIEKSFKFIIEQKNYLCYMIDYGTNTVKKVNGADILAVLADKLTA